jgi:hypothetical protein
LIAASVEASSSSRRLTAEPAATIAAAVRQAASIVGKEMRCATTCSGIP